MIFLLVFLLSKDFPHIFNSSKYISYLNINAWVLDRSCLNNLILEASQSQRPICLRVLAVNLAKMFYEKLGFVVTEVTSDFLYMEKLP